MLVAALLLIPVLASIVSFFAPSRKEMEISNLAAYVIVWLISIFSAWQVVTGGPMALFGGFLYIDALSALINVLTASIVLVCGVYTVGYLRRDQGSDVNGRNSDTARLSKLRKYYTLTPLFVCSMLTVGVANNLGVMWVAVEATTLASVFLVTYHGRVHSLEAAWKYAIIGGVGLSMALLGTILTYYSAHGVIGTDTVAGLNWSVLVQSARQFDHPTMRLAFVLVLLGFGTKAGVAPMHTWKPDAYSEAPVPVAAMLAAAVMNTAMYALARFYILTSKCLGAEFGSGLFIFFGLLSMGIAVPFILVQGNFRRLLAYSSIDHAGIMLLGLGFGGPLGALGTFLHMTFHSFTKPLLFLCAGNMQQQLKTDTLRRTKGGLIHVMPVTGAALLIGMLAVTGSPPFSMFQSEFIILRAAFDRGHVGPAILFIIFVVGIFIGFLWHIGRLVLGPGSGGPMAEVSGWKEVPVVVLSLVLLVVAFWLPYPVYALIQAAGSIVTGVQ